MGLLIQYDLQAPWMPLEVKSHQPGVTNFSTSREARISFFMEGGKGGLRRKD